MHGVNLDLLRAATRQPDPHAHHKDELLALQRAARRQRWRDRLVARLRALFAHRPAPARKACPDQLS